MKETEVQRQVLEYLTYHPGVAWMRRYNSGKMAVKGGGKTYWVDMVRAAKGIKFTQLDLLGMLKDGRLLAVEIKKPGEEPTREQWDEIHSINRNNGVAFWCNSIEMAAQQMDKFMLSLPDDNIRQPDFFCSNGMHGGLK